jgi:hypothetical protein
MFNSRNSAGHITYESKKKKKVDSHKEKYMDKNAPDILFERFLP